jgi:hypothetical protein
MMDLEQGLIVMEAMKDIDYEKNRMMKAKFE